MGKTYKTKLNVTSKRTLDILKRMSGIYRASYNLGIDAQFYKQTLGSRFSNYDHHWISGKDLHKILHDHNMPAFVKEVDTGVFDAAIYASSKAFTSAFRFKLPKYYSRKKTGMKFKTYGKVKIFHDYITVPKLGKIKLYEKGFIPQGKKYRNITFTHDGSDWWLSLEVDEPMEKESLTGAPVFVLPQRDGTFQINSGTISDVTKSEKYKKLVGKLKKLNKKFVRQSKNNRVLDEHCKVVTRTSRNMLKTRKRITSLKARMANIRKDYFRKVACEVARTKPTELHVPSLTVLKHDMQGLLSRKLRQSDSMHLFNLIRKKLTLMGVRVVSYLDFGAYQEALSSRVYACGG